MIWDIQNIEAILGILAVAFAIMTWILAKVSKFRLKSLSMFHFLKISKLEGIIDEQKIHQSELKRQIITDFELIKNGFCGPIIKPCDKDKYRHEILLTFQEMGLNLLETYDKLHITWNITLNTENDIKLKSFEDWFFKVKEFSDKDRKDSIEVFRYVFIDSFLIANKNERYINILKNISKKEYFPFSREYNYITFFIPIGTFSERSIEGDYAIFESAKSKNATICQFSKTEGDILYIYFIKNKYIVKKYKSNFTFLDKIKNKYNTWDRLFKEYNIQC